MTLPDGWREAPLGDLVDVLDGQRVPVSAAERAKRPGGVPYYGAAGRVGFIDSPLFDEDLVLLGEDGVQFFDPVRPKAYRITGPAWVNNHAHVLRARPVIDWRYLTHFLNQVNYRGYANGTTRLKLTQGAMRRIRVALPPLDEQRRIVEMLEEHLSSLDSGDRDLVNGLKRLERLVLAQLSAAIDGVRSLPLAELAVDSGYGTSVKCVVGGAGPRVIRIPNIVAGSIDLVDEKRALNADVDLRTLMVSEGDLLIIRTNGSRKLIGRSAVVGAGIEASFASYLIRYRFNRAAVSPYWVQRALGLPSIRAQIESLAASSAGQYNLSLAKLAGVRLPVPSLSEQHSLASAARKVEDYAGVLRRTAETQRVRSTALRRALLQAAFSGQLAGRSSDLDRAEELVS